MHLMVQFDQQWSQAEIAHAAESVGLPLVSSASYYSGAARANEFLAPFAGISAEKIDSTVKAFAQALLSS